MSHTILLIQSTPKPDSRTWSDYESVEDAINAVCKIFEEHLKKVHPSKPSITYEINELFEFLERLGDLTCLVFDDSRSVYIPKSRDWIKRQLYISLRQQLKQP